MRDPGELRSHGSLHLLGVLCRIRWAVGVMMDDEGGEVWLPVDDDRGVLPRHVVLGDGWSWCRTCRR